MYVYSTSCYRILDPVLTVHCLAFYQPMTHICCETFSFMMSHPAMSLGDRFCMSRKGGTGGGEWVHLKGANRMAVPGLA